MHTAISDTSESLAATLNGALSTAIGAFSAGTLQTRIDDPATMARGADRGLAVWLYRVSRDEQTLNRPRVRIGPGEYEQVPFPLRLYYLVTPVLDPDPQASQTAQRILGVVLQTFHDRPILRGADLPDRLAAARTELHVRFDPSATEDLVRIWDGLEEPYELSVAYEVSVVRVASARPPVHVPDVLELETASSLIVSSEPA